MRVSTLVSFASLWFATPGSSHVIERQASSTSTTINLGDAGTWVGVLQNNGTVKSWKGIPYATPPIGDLRFAAPKALGSLNGQVGNVTDDALRCVQFTAPGPNIVGVKSGPGQEDCLKLWVWAPVGAKEGDNLPVMVYTHGGGLQYSAAPNNDFSDWVGQSKDFIAVSAAYRVGGFGFMASTELPQANVGLLDSRLAVDWVVANIGKFGGNGKKITIMGQSGGAYSVVSQMALYDGKKPNFQQGIARSIQRSPMFTVAYLKERNQKLMTILGCNSTTSELACFRAASPAVFVNATLSLATMKDSKGLSFGGFLPTVDGVTLTDTVGNLWSAGKVSKVPWIGGYVTDEGAFATSNTATALNASSLGTFNLSSSNIASAASFYPLNNTYAGPDGEGNFFLSTFEALEQATASFGEAGISGSETFFNRAMCQAVGNGAKTWASRFNAPTVGTVYFNESFPLAPVSHSADNSYLQNATSVMRPFEVPVALEWRAYIGSFIKTGDPNTQKLSTARTWHCYDAIGDCADQPLRLVTAFAFSSTANKNAPTGTQMEIPQRPQLERMGWWQQKSVLKELGFA